MAKGGSEFATVELEGWEIAGEYRRLWPDRELAESQVLRIQAKLHQWAVDDPDRRFDDLLNLVCDPAVLVVAWARVRGNRGKRSAGVDGLRPQSIFSAEEGFLPQLREDLKTRQFAPLPVRERMIPKPAAASCDGWASRLHGTAPCKRPSNWCSSRSSRRISSHARMASDRDGQDAIAEIHQFTSRSYEWVLEGDIEACRHDRPSGPDGPGAVTGRGQTCLGGGESVPACRCPR
jgi:RNA-directed DNA polymerase